MFVRLFFYCKYVCLFVMKYYKIFANNKTNKIIKIVMCFKSVNKKYKINSENSLKL